MTNEQLDELLKNAKPTCWVDGESAWAWFEEKTYIQPKKNYHLPQEIYKKLSETIPLFYPTESAAMEALREAVSKYKEKRDDEKEAS